MFEQVTDLSTGITSQREFSTTEADAINIERAPKLNDLINEVKKEAANRILRRYPDWKQANMNMRANELNDIRFDRTLTTEEEVERQTLKEIATWIKSVRSASDSIEARLSSEPNLMITDDSLWPV
jgi:hypothetical protein